MTNKYTRKDLGKGMQKEQENNACSHLGGNKGSGLNPNICLDGCMPTTVLIYLKSPLSSNYYTSNT